MEDPKYVILEAKYRKTLEFVVNIAIDSGYVPVGGVGISIIGKANVAKDFYQAMLKKSN